MSEPTTTETAETPDAAPESPAQETKTVDWEAEARKWEKRSKDNFAKLKDAEPKLAEYAQIVESRKSEQEKLTEELTRWQTQTETWQGIAMSNRIEALASEFADPSDAVAGLASKNYLDAGGQIDDAAIQSDLAALLEKKPHWRRPESATPPTPRLPAPNGAQGTSANPPVNNPAAQFSSFLRDAINRQ